MVVCNKPEPGENPWSRSWESLLANFSILGCAWQTGLECEVLPKWESVLLLFEPEDFWFLVDGCCKPLLWYSLTESWSEDLTVRRSSIQGIIALSSRILIRRQISLGKQILSTEYWGHLPSQTDSYSTLKNFQTSGGGFPDSSTEPAIHQVRASKVVWACPTLQQSGIQFGI